MPVQPPGDRRRRAPGLGHEPQPIRPADPAPELQPRSQGQALTPQQLDLLDATHSVVLTGSNATGLDLQAVELP